MDRVRTNATLFAEHSASIKRSYAALDTRVVSRFAVTRDSLFLLFAFSPAFLPLTRLPFPVSFGLFLVSSTLSPFLLLFFGFLVFCVYSGLSNPPFALFFCSILNL